MNIGGGEAADQLVRMMLSGGEVAVRLSGSALKNLLALSLALSKSHKTISGKVNLSQMLKETRDLRTFPMTRTQYAQFRKQAKKQKLLYSAIHDRDDSGTLIDVVMPAAEVERANLIFARILKDTQPEQADQAQEAPEQQEPAREALERQPGQRQTRTQPEEQEPPLAPQNGPLEQSQEMTAERRQVTVRQVDVLKKGSPSQRASPGTRASSDTCGARTTRTTSDRPSVEARLAGYRKQVESRKKATPVREKAKAKTVKKAR